MPSKGRSRQLEKLPLLLWVEDPEQKIRFVFSGTKNLPGYMVSDQAEKYSTY